MGRDKGRETGKWSGEIKGDGRAMIEDSQRNGEEME